MVKGYFIIFLLAAWHLMISTRAPAFILDRPETWEQTTDTYIDNLRNQELVRFCRSVLVIRGWKQGLPLVENLSQEDVAGSYYFNFVSHINLDWDLKLNAPDFTVLENKDNPKASIAKYSELFALSQADCLVVASRKGWSLIQRDETKLLVRNSTAQKKISEHTIKQWLKKHLGYDGLVLAREQNQVLIAGFSEDLREKNQKAIVVQNSAKIVKIKNRDVEGAALMSLKAFHRNFAVFKILRLAPGAKIMPGDKVILE